MIRHIIKTTARIIAVIAIAGKFTADAQIYDNMVKMSPSSKVSYAARIIENYYIDNVDGQKVADEAIIAMLKTLDPHSQYSDPEETADLTTPLEGNFSGIGIQFQMLNDTLNVIQTISGGPSERVGILPGDRILTADGEPISGASLPNSAITSKLRGPKGSKVKIEVSRPRTPETIEFQITRDDIPVNSIDAAYMADDGVGYVRISRFGATTNDELTDALHTLERQGMKVLIIDLEDNGGGYLDAAVRIASKFLNRGDLITYTESPRTGETQPFFAERNGNYRAMPIVVMVNQYSASASEILAGAIQDHDRGVIVGRRTFGKGLVQRPFPFPDGSMIRLTISRYHTPSGRVIQKPYTLGDDKSYKHDIIDRLEGGELTDAEAISLPDSLKFNTLRLNRPVYGGGGIVPDRFVALDTTMYSPYYRDLVAKAVINRVALEYVNDNRDELLGLYPTDRQFVESYEIADTMLDYLIKTGADEGVEFNEEQYEKSLPVIKAILKGIIGRNLYDISTYYKVVQPMLNPTYRKAVEIARNRDSEKLLNMQ